MARGVEMEDVESGKTFHLTANVIVNATGVFVDEILKMDKPSGQPMVRPSQGAHVVLDSSFLKGNVALMIPKTADGRVLFAVPWHGKVLVGTTDTPLNEHRLEPVALEEEVTFILNTAGQYLSRKPSREDVLSVFAGLRPLAAPGKDTNSTKEISRSHKLIVADSGLITITGGKWTTYRKMAMDVVDKAISMNLLSPKKCITEGVHIHGYKKMDPENSLSIYGTDADSIRKLMKENISMGAPLHPSYAFTKAEVVWMVRSEMARKVEDVLSRRVRLLFLDALAAIALAPAVAEIMAEELGKDKKWVEDQVQDFNKLAQDYLLYEVLPADKLSKETLKTGS
ncbi:Glycerol-3-phosphate dehydrogenase 2 [compost metagenome]